MPYVEKELRKKLEKGELPESAGTLNYLITLQINKYLKLHGLTYTTINGILGALTGATLEFYARVARPYEDKSKKRNGDVYDNKM